MDKPFDPVIRPVTRVNKADKPGQPKVCNCVKSRHLPGAIACPDCAIIEQPNTELMIIKTIQGLISTVNGKLGKLCVYASSENKALLMQAFEEIDLFQRTTLNKLQKAFE